MTSASHGCADRIKSKSKTNVWVEILGLVAKHGALNMALGFPDFPPPYHVREALSVAAIGKNHMLNHYTRGAGHPRLVAILGKLYSRELQHNVDPMTNVITTIGAFDALYTTFQALINPGDEVILIEPFYEPYKEIVRLSGAVAKYVSLVPKNGCTSSDDWVYDSQELQAAFSHKTKAIIVNNPMNPLGKVFTKEELQEISDLCIRYDVLCIADEVYEWLTYGGRHTIRMASLPGMFDRTITIGSAGKTFTVTGWKVGWAIGPCNLIGPLQAFHHNSIRTNPTPLQEAVAVAFETEFERLDSPDCYFPTLAKEMEEKRDQLAGYLREAGLHPIIPSGGYFIIADISSLDTNGAIDDTCSDTAYDYKFVKWAIQEKKFCAVPMSIFFCENHRQLGEKYIRICFVKTEETIEKARTILQKWNTDQSNGHDHVNGTNGIVTNGRRHDFTNGQR